MNDFQDGDGYVTYDEMRAWIQYTQQRYVNEDVDKQWQQHTGTKAEDPTASVSWEVYRETVYGFLDEEKTDKQKEEDGEDEVENEVRF
jgi:hypothetical protein